MIDKNNETISVEIADASSFTRQFVSFNSNESFLNSFVDVLLIFKEESPLSKKIVSVFADQIKIYYAISHVLNISLMRRR